jgi:hypothetical protein
MPTNRRESPDADEKNKKPANVNEREGSLARLYALDRERFESSLRRQARRLEASVA